MKSNTNGRELFNFFKVILNLLSDIIRVLPYSIKKFFLVLFRHCPGKTGIGIRYVLIKAIAKKCGDNVAIHPGVFLFSPEKLSLGNNISIHPMSYIDAGGEIEIGNNVSIAHGVSILTSTHTYSDMNIPIKYQKILFNSVIIKNNVWIGAKSTVLCGIKIDSGSIIGANALVNKNVTSNTIVAGVPIKIIKLKRMS